MWSAHHIAFWLPLALGLAIIAWANWGWLSMRVKSRRTRNLGLLAVLALSFYVSGLADEVGAQQQVPHVPPAPQQTGSASGQGSIGINNGSNTNIFNPPPKSPPQQPSPSITVTGNGNIIAPNNKGPITQYNIGPKPPTLRYLGTQPVQKRRDGTYAFMWFFEVVSDVPAKTLTCVAKNDGNVLDVGIGSYLATQFSSGKDAEGKPYAILKNASGKYDLDINATAQTPIPTATCRVE